MSIKEKLDPILEKWNLLQHPFYRAWSEGRLSAAALQTYASEYSDFIGLLPFGWEQLGDRATAEEEREHVELWNDFAAALGGSARSARLPQTKALEEKAIELFSDHASALGALYAFEAQQPATAASKLEGLESYYNLPEEAHAYFRVHQENAGEAQSILAQLEGLSEDEQAAAIRACENIAEALWDELSGIQAAAFQE